MNLRKARRWKSSIVQMTRRPVPLKVLLLLMRRKNLWRLFRSACLLEGAGYRLDVARKQSKMTDLRPAFLWCWMHFQYEAGIMIQIAILALC